MINILDYDYVVFDCDGVILDSNRLKTETFARVLDGYPEEYVEKMITYHKDNGGVSRYKKFRYYFEEIYPCKDADKRVKQTVARFAEMVYKGLMECKYIPGVLDFIKELKEKDLDLFVVSGSDEEELREVFSKREIASFFSAIFGSPPTKSENMIKVTDIVADRTRGILFGDSKSDMEAAEEFGIEFVFVKGASEWKEGNSLVKKNNKYSIHDFRSKE